MRDWGLSHRFAGAGDRAAIGNLVYDALRRRTSHAYAMKDESARALAISVLVRDWGEDPAALSASFADDKFAPEPLTDEESALLGAEDPLRDAPDHIKGDLPQWLVPMFSAAFGDDWVPQARALSGRPPVDLRANTLKTSRDKVEKSLRRFTPAVAAVAPNGLRLEAGPGSSRTPNIQSDESYLKGWVEVQDQGSQIVALLAGAAPGEQILDFCAGAGGKTLALAADMQNKGQIFAHDSDRQRLAPIYDRLKRAGVRNVQVRPPSPDVLDDLAARMDLVLVDAPCSGTGTWRRRPDAKWRLSPDQLEQRCAEQAAILGEAAHIRQTGGAAGLYHLLAASGRERRTGRDLPQGPRGFCRARSAGSHLQPLAGAAGPLAEKRRRHHADPVLNRHGRFFHCRSRTPELIQTAGDAVIRA